MKFKILPKVHGFTDAQGVHHLPGETVDLPPSYAGETWLEPVEKPSKPKAPPAKIEKAEEKTPEEEKPTPLEKEKTSKGKKSKS